MPNKHMDQSLKYLARKRGAFLEDINRMVVFERDHGKCGICGEDVDPNRFQIDHIIPLSRGGKHSYDNVQTAHPLCNNKKWARI